MPEYVGVATGRNQMLLIYIGSTEYEFDSRTSSPIITVFLYVSVLRTYLNCLQRCISMIILHKSVFKKIRIEVQ